MEMGFFWVTDQVKLKAFDYSGIQGKKTWAIILANIMMPNTIKKSAHGTYTRRTLHVSYQGQQRQVLCEGVLEISPTDISAPLRSRAYRS